MGRPARASPHSSQPYASRIEKPRRTQKARHQFPGWFSRVRSQRWLRYLQNKSTCYNVTVSKYADFDEDLSDLEPCEDHLGDICECYLDGNESERSYEGHGSDVQEYYELKEERETRKRMLIVEAQRLEEEKEWHRLLEEQSSGMEKDKTEQMEIAKKKEAEVEVAFEAARRARRLRIGQETERRHLDSIVNQRFHLFSSKLLDRRYRQDNTMYVDFHYTNSGGNGAERQIKGHLYLDSNASCFFGPFPIPMRASSRTGWFKSFDLNYEVTLQFLANGYLKLSVSRNLIFGGFSPIEPLMCDFVGILFDRREGKEAIEKENERREAEIKRREQRKKDREKEKEKVKAVALAVERAERQAEVEKENNARAVVLAMEGARLAEDGITLAHRVIRCLGRQTGFNKGKESAS